MASHALLGCALLVADAAAGFRLLFPVAIGPACFETVARALVLALAPALLLEEEAEEEEDGMVVVVSEGDMTEEEEEEDDAGFGLSDLAVSAAIRARAATESGFPAPRRVRFLRASAKACAMA